MIRRLAKVGLQQGPRLKRWCVTSYCLPPGAPLPENQTPKWMQFFISQMPDIQFDLDRTLLNAQQDEADDYAVRYILSNYEKLKTYQLVRSLLFVNHFVSRSKIVEQLRKNILKGDIELFPTDLEVIVRLYLIFFFDDPLLIEFSVYNMAKHFPNQDFIGKVYSMAFMVLVSKVSEMAVEDYLKELRSIDSKTKDLFAKEFAGWTRELQFYFLLSLQGLELSLKNEKDRTLVKTFLSRHYNQVQDE
jgi:hypothetical protein